jgi:hypothetical protein
MSRIGVLHDEAGERRPPFDLLRQRIRTPLQDQPLRW